MSVKKDKRMFADLIPFFGKDGDDRPRLILDILYQKYLKAPGTLHPITEDDVSDKILGQFKPSNYSLEISGIDDTIAHPEILVFFNDLKEHMKTYTTDTILQSKLLEIIKNTNDAAINADPENYFRSQVISALGTPRNAKKHTISSINKWHEAISFKPRIDLSQIITDEAMNRLAGELSSVKDQVPPINIAFSFKLDHYHRDKLLEDSMTNNIIIPTTNTFFTNNDEFENVYFRNINDGMDKIYKMINGVKVCVDYNSEYGQDKANTDAKICKNVGFKNAKKCSDYIGKCLIPSGSNTKENVKACKIFMQDPSYWEIIHNEVSDMLPELALKTLTKFGFYKNSVYDIKAKMTLEKVEEISVWLARLRVLAGFTAPVMAGGGGSLDELDSLKKALRLSKENIRRNNSLLDIKKAMLDRNNILRAEAEEQKRQDQVDAITNLISATENEVTEIKKTLTELESGIGRIENDIRSIEKELNPTSITGLDVVKYLEKLSTHIKTIKEKIDDSDKANLIRKEITQDLEDGDPFTIIISAIELENEFIQKKIMTLKELLKKFQDDLKDSKLNLKKETDVDIKVESEKNIKKKEEDIINTNEDIIYAQNQLDRNLKYMLPFKKVTTRIELIKKRLVNLDKVDKTIYTINDTDKTSKSSTGGPTSPTGSIGSPTSPTGSIGSPTSSTTPTGTPTGGTPTGGTGTGGPTTGKRSAGKKDIILSKTEYSRIVANDKLLGYLGLLVQKINLNPVILNPKYSGVTAESCSDNPSPYKNWKLSKYNILPRKMYTMIPIFPPRLQNLVNLNTSVLKNIVAMPHTIHGALRGSLRGMFGGAGNDNSYVYDIDQILKNYAPSSVIFQNIINSLVSNLEGVNKVIEKGTLEEIQKLVTNLKNTENNLMKTAQALARSVQIADVYKGNGAPQVITFDIMEKILSAVTTGCAKTIKKTINVSELFELVNQAQETQSTHLLSNGTRLNNSVPLSGILANS